MWNREFGSSPSVVGQAIRIHGHQYTIVGVLPAEYTGMVTLIAPEVAAESGRHDHGSDSRRRRRAAEGNAA
jgi:hypothetical protein